MKLSEAIGTAASIVFAATVMILFASKPPLYAYWNENLGRISSLKAGDLGLVISKHIWTELFPALIGFLMVIIALILGVSALLRRE